MSKWVSYGIALATAAAAAFAYLPYGWAHLIAGSVLAGASALQLVAINGHPIASSLRRAADRISPSTSPTGHGNP